MSRAERDKGARGEREVAAVFRAAGFDCDRTPNSGGLRLRGDLYGDVTAHVEVKRQETLRLPLWLRQARDEADPGTTPVVAFRQNGGNWFAALPLRALAADLAAARDFAAYRERLRPVLAEAAAALQDAAANGGAPTMYRMAGERVRDALAGLDQDGARG